MEKNKLMFGVFRPFQLTPEAEERVIKGREVIDAFIREDRGVVFLFTLALLHN